MNWVWENSPTSGTELLLLLAIADCADDYGRNAFPSRTTLARKLRMNPSTVRRLVRKLENAGQLRVERSVGRHQTNSYSLVLHTAQAPVENPVDKSPENGAGCPGAICPPGQSAPSGEATGTEKGGAAVPPRTTRTVLGGGGAREPTVHDITSPAPGDPIADAVLDGLGSAWHLTPAQRSRLRPRILDALLNGWSIPNLISYLSANPRGVHSPFAVLSKRIEDLPPNRPRKQAGSRKPAWCGVCDEHTRHEETAAGLRRCPRCHPHRTITEPI
ncbi:helix-turn-helix domain-containing protein [Sciscionella marina]|uniref:helix-turn-helix domain-containing protein n=1 Tax=Sciscionella marina TaxID=508770 RepID=UPI0012F6EA19